MRKAIAALKAIRRRLYATRALVPGLRDRHHLEAMVGPLGYWHELRAYQLRTLRENGLQPHHRLLDIGCGPLQGGIAFIQYLEPSNYVGIDINPVKLSAGYRQIGELNLAHKNPLLLLSKTFGAGRFQEQLFDYIWASQVLYYFDQSQLRELFALVAAHLRSTGKFLADVIGPQHPDYRHPAQSRFLSNIHLHQPDSMDAIARPLGLRASALHEIAYYGYPKRLSLRTNLLIQIQRANSTDSQTSEKLPQTRSLGPEEPIAA